MVDRSLAQDGPWVSVAVFKCRLWIVPEANSNGSRHVRDKIDARRNRPHSSAHEVRHRHRLGQGEEVITLEVIQYKKRKNTL